MTVVDPFLEVRASLTALLAPFVASGAASVAEIHLALELGRLGDERRPGVLALLAMALAAPRRGDVGVALARPELAALVEARAGLADCPLVGTRGDATPRPFLVEGELLYTARAFEEESALAAALLARAAEPPMALDHARARGIFTCLFDDAERATAAPPAMAVAVALTRRLAVIVGGPGTGKTYNIRRLLAARFELAREGALPWPRVALAAPTGKAAARIKEALVEGVDALPVSEPTRSAIVSLRAQTLHKLLGVDPRRPGRPRHHAGAPLPFDLVIVDESSMVDLSLMSQLVAAVRAEATLVLLGDPQQLPSVDAGAVLGDIVTRASTPPRYRPETATALGALFDASVQLDATVEPLAECIVSLTTARRFDAEGSVGKLAAAIARGGDAGVRDALALLDDTPGLALAPHGGRGQLSEARLEALVAPYRDYFALARRGPDADELLARFHRRLLARFDDYRVLAVLRGSSLGAEAVSESIARRLLDRGGSVSSPFVGKPLLVRQNRYDVDLRNGDVGIVVRDAERALRVVFPAEGDQVRYLPLDRLPPAELAFATTVHKAQGSQFQRVALVLPNAPTPVLSAETVYTAVTRARQEVTVVGARALLEEALGLRVSRASGLPRLLASRASS